MKLLKMALVAGMAAVMTITTINNILMPSATFGAIAAALSMATTFKNPMEIWRAITSPTWLWIIAVLIIICGDRRDPVLDRCRALIQRTPQRRAIQSVQV